MAAAEVDELELLDVEDELELELDDEIGTGSKAFATVCTPGRCLSVLTTGRTAAPRAVGAATTSSTGRVADCVITLGRRAFEVADAKVPVLNATDPSNPGVVAVLDEPELTCILDLLEETLELDPEADPDETAAPSAIDAANAAKERKEMDEFRMI